MSGIIKLSDEYHDDDTAGGVLAERKVRTQLPAMYKVLLLNDDFTPMEFVIEVLESFFRKDHAAATEIMLNVHNKGRGVCGIYTYSVAETKVAQVNEYARQNKHPLQCVMEKA